MSGIVLYLPRREELATVMAAAVFLLRQRGMQITPLCTARQTELTPFLGQESLGLLVCDVTSEGMLALLEQLRTCNPDMKLVLLSDETVSPVAYIRPSILPTALIWRPVERGAAQEALRQVVDTLSHGQTEATEEAASFSIDARGVVRTFPFRDILFFEAREKRLFLHVHRKEVAFNGTLEGLLETLPPEFIRIHKSVIINRTKVAEIRFGQNMVLLEDGTDVPVSRSYKARLKEVFS